MEGTQSLRLRLLKNSESGKIVKIDDTVGKAIA